jgi:hypothetical protein
MAGRADQLPQKAHGGSGILLGDVVIDALHGDVLDIRTHACGLGEGFCRNEGAFLPTNGNGRNFDILIGLVLVLVETV